MAGTPDERALRALLGVDRAATWEQVRRAFRDAVRASHPDLHTGDRSAEQRLKTLNGLWETINTPGKWAQYVARPAPTARADTPNGRRPGPPPPPPSLARLRVQRQLSGAAGMRQWRLELDGEVVGSIANGATTVLDVEPGRHAVRVFYDWYGSGPLEIELRAGHEVHLGCRQQTGSLRSLASPKRALLVELLASRRVT